ncbi:MAG TPA: hypothetical protein VG317_01915 [Pseudonocardiaceae bacterium]|jgi:hypothetical protein|nr:hypothetical protein [Pseudonocardiaceae bacterium]
MSEETANETGKNPSWWRRVGRGPKWLIATIAPIIVATAVPGVAPWATDHIRDLLGQPPLSAISSAEPGLLAGSYWATNSILTAPYSDEIYTAIQNEGGVQIGTSGQLITLTSNRAGQIDIEQVTAVIEARQPPLAGTAFIAPPQGGGIGLTVQFHLDSGDQVPALVPSDPNYPDKNLKPYLADGSYLYLEQGKSEPIAIQATTTTCYCQWRVRINYVYRGQAGQITVPPPGQRPFGTTAWASHYRVEYDTNVFHAGIPPARYDCVAEPARCEVGPFR